MTAAGQNSIDRGTGRRAPLEGPLGRAARLAWTVISFSLFAIGGLLFGLVVAPCLFLLVRDDQRRKHVARGMISWLFGAFIRFMALVGLTWQVDGLPTGGRPRHCVVVANHPTLIDAVFLLWLFPGADCVVKAAHWRNPVTMFAVRAAGYLPNNDDETLLHEAVRRVRSGGCLVLFPQGTRAREGEEPVFRRGAAVIAARAEADLLPVRIRCRPHILRKGETWFRNTRHRPHFHLQVLDALQPATWTEGDRGERGGTRELTNRLSTLLLKAVHSSPSKAA